MANFPASLPTSALQLGHLCSNTLVSSKQKGIRQQPQHTLKYKCRLRTFNALNVKCINSPKGHYNAACEPRAEPAPLADFGGDPLLAVGALHLRRQLPKLELIHEYGVGTRRDGGGARLILDGSRI